MMLQSATPITSFPLPLHSHSIVTLVLDRKFGTTMDRVSTTPGNPGYPGNLLYKY